MERNSSRCSRNHIYNHICSNGAHPKKSRRRKESAVTIPKSLVLWCDGRQSDLAWDRCGNLWNREDDTSEYGRCKTTPSNPFSRTALLEWKPASAAKYFYMNFNEHLLGDPSSPGVSSKREHSIERRRQPRLFFPPGANGCTNLLRSCGRSKSRENSSKVGVEPKRKHAVFFFPKVDQGFDQRIVYPETSQWQNVLILTPESKSALCGHALCPSSQRCRLKRNAIAQL